MNQVCSWYQQLGQSSKLGMPKTSTSSVTSLPNTQPAVLLLCRHGPGGIDLLSVCARLYPLHSVHICHTGTYMLSGTLRSFCKRFDLAEILHAAAHDSIPPDAPGEWAHNKCVPCRLTSTQQVYLLHTINQVSNPLLGNKQLITSEALLWQIGAHDLQAWYAGSQVMSSPADSVVANVLTATRRQYASSQVSRTHVAFA